MPLPELAQHVRIFNKLEMGKNDVFDNTQQFFAAKRKLVFK